MPPTQRSLGFSYTFHSTSPIIVSAYTVAWSDKSPAPSTQAVTRLLIWVSADSDRASGRRVTIQRFLEKCGRRVTGKRAAEPGGLSMNPVYAKLSDPPRMPGG